MDPDGFPASLDHRPSFGMAIGEMFQTVHLAADCASDGFDEGSLCRRPQHCRWTGGPPNALVIK